MLTSRVNSLLACHNVNLGMQEENIESVATNSVHWYKNCAMYLLHAPGSPFLQL